MGRRERKKLRRWEDEKVGEKRDLGFRWQIVDCGKEGDRFQVSGVRGQKADDRGKKSEEI
jgi:hypothetical protein